MRIQANHYHCFSKHFMHSHEVYGISYFGWSRKGMETVNIWKSSLIKNCNFNPYSSKSFKPADKCLLKGLIIPCQSINHYRHKKLRNCNFHLKLSYGARLQFYHLFPIYTEMQKKYNGRKSCIIKSCNVTLCSLHVL